MVQYPGDGVLVYFGHSIANKNDDESAVLVDLAMLEAVANSKVLRCAPALPLARAWSSSAILLGRA